MGDIERQLRWALICGIDGHWYALMCGIDGHWYALMCGIDGHWYALMCGIDVALMGTSMWH
ncbi:unnamed protein product [Staurois parvus]|uniref:Uncharacterized protein n=1 Tax=Staurois parvus TaxID=386267 RepID=A0ABN9APK2_9NEOB|nr:unnamed protein product [Staurois parvus]